MSDWYFHGHNWLEAKEKLTSIIFRKKDVQHEIIISSKLRKLHEMIQRTKKLESSLFENFAEDKPDKHLVNGKSFDRLLNEAISLKESCDEQDQKVLNLESNICSYIELNNPRGLCDTLKEQEQIDFGTVLNKIIKYKSY